MPIYIYLFFYLVRFKGIYTDNYCGNGGYRRWPKFKCEKHYESFASTDEKKKLAYKKDLQFYVCLQVRESCWVGREAEGTSGSIWRATAVLL